MLANTHVILCTIPHTGTRYLLSELKPFFSIVRMPTTVSPDLYKQLILYQMHCTNINMPSILTRADDDDIPIITTCRAYSQIKSSWKRHYHGKILHLNECYNNWAEKITSRAKWKVNLHEDSASKIDSVIQELTE